MSQQGGSGQSRNTDEQVMMMIVGIGVAIVLAMLYLASQIDNINRVLSAVAWVHLAPAGYAAYAFPVLTDIPVVGPWLFRPSLAALRYFAQTDYATLMREDGGAVLGIAGRSAMLVYAPVFAFLAVRGRGLRPDQIYRKLHSLESMIRFQSQVRTGIRYSVGVNPRDASSMSVISLSKAQHAALPKEEKADLGIMIHPGIAIPKIGAWEPALRPEEWLVAQGLVTRRSDLERVAAAGWSATPRELERRDLWEDLQVKDLEEAFASQLRVPWSGSFDVLRPCEKVVMAAFVLLYDNVGSALGRGGRKKAESLLSDAHAIWNSVKCEPGRLDAALRAETEYMSMVGTILAGADARDLADNVGSRHAWKETAFLAMCFKARDRRGILASSLYIFLKNESRPFWYCLSNMGSRSVMVECAGIYAHYRAENQFDMPIRRPAVWQTARAMFEEYLDLREDRLETRRRRRQEKVSPGEAIRTRAMSSQNIAAE